MLLQADLRLYYMIPQFQVIFNAPPSLLVYNTPMTLAKAGCPGDNWAVRHGPDCGHTGQVCHSLPNWQRPTASYVLMSLTPGLPGDQRLTSHDAPCILTLWYNELDTAGRSPLGSRDRRAAQVAVLINQLSPNSCLGLEPVSTRPDQEQGRKRNGTVLCGH
jgi:hypothetical protein